MLVFGRVYDVLASRAVASLWTMLIISMISMFRDDVVRDDVGASGRVSADYGDNHYYDDESYDSAGCDHGHHGVGHGEVDFCDVCYDEPPSPTRPSSDCPFTTIMITA